MSEQTVLLLDSNAGWIVLLEQISHAVADAGFDVHFLADIEDLLTQLGDATARVHSSGVVLIGPEVPDPLATAARVAEAAPGAEIIILSDAPGEHPHRREIEEAGMNVTVARHDDPGFPELIRGAAGRAQAHPASAAASAAAARMADIVTESDHYLATILTHAQDAIISTDANGHVRTWNHGAHALLAVAAPEALGRPVQDLAGGDWHQQLESLVRIVRRGGTIGTRSLNVTRLDGTDAEIELSLAPVRDDDGAQIGIAIIARDITIRLRSERERMRLADHIKLLLDSTGEGILGIDGQGSITFINPAGAAMLGYTPEELLGRNAHRTVHHHHEDGSEYPENECPVTATRITGVIGRSYSEVYWRQDGSWFPVHFSSFPVVVDGHVDGAVITFNDVTDRRTVREELERSQAELDVILQGVADGITAQDPSGRLIYANLAAARLSGFETVEELLGASITEVVRKFNVADENGRPFDPADFPGRKALSGEDSPETVVQFGTGVERDRRWTVVKARPVFDHEGKVRFAINIFRDVTHIKEAEARLRFLAEASEVLASSLDYETTLASVARLSVPMMGDWAAVDMLGPDGTIERLAVAHIDPAKVEWAHELQRRFPPDPDAVTGVPNVLRTGRTEFYPHLTEEMLAGESTEVLDIIKQLGLRSVLIVPLIVRGKPIGAISFVHAESGRQYSESDITLAEDLARRAGVAVDNAWLHHTTHEQSEWLSVTLSSIGDAVIATDTVGRITFMNPVAERLTGWLSSEAYGHDLLDAFRIINEETLKTAENPVEKVIRTGFVVGLANHTVLIAKDGTEVPIDDSAAPIRDTTGKMIGVVMVFHDITERRRAERERAELLQREQQARAEAEENERQYRTMAEAMPQIVWTTTATGVAEYYNGWWLEYSGLTLEDSLSPSSRGIVHPDDLERTVAAWNHALRTGEEFECEHRMRRASDGSYRWHLARTIPVRNAEGEIIRWIGTATDIDAQKRAEDRMQFLAAASELLSSSLDYQTTLTSVTNLAVPKIGDWASVDMLAADGSIQRLAVAHVDPEKVMWAHELQRRFPPDPNAPTGVPNVLRTGQSEFYPLITDEMLKALPLEPEMWEIIDRIGFRSAMTVPLIVRGQAVGAISFVATTESGRLYTEWDLALAEDLARRASMAIENAELFMTARNEIAERKQVEVDLKRAKESAEAANQAKDRFLAVLSHELRTPLTPVLTLTQALKEEDLPGDVRAFVEIIDRNVELEARLIDDLLDLTRIEKGKLQLNIETVDAHVLMQNVLQIYRGDILAKKLHLTLHLDAPEHFVHADPARLQQIYWNLVKNAVKFTPEGGSVMIRTFNDESQHLLVEVIDNGIGIDPITLPQIFTAFEQGDHGITRQFGGLGLGLAISKALVDMHGGTLTAASEGPGRGATFTVEFAMALRQAEPARRTAEPAGDITGGVERRILLVDDHEDTSKVMKVLLERRGYRVTTAATMRTGIDAATNGTFDLLISDIGLPDGSGLDLMATLIRTGISIKAIALSGFGMEEDVRRSKEVGFTEHLTKPISFQKLQTIIERLISQ